MAAFNSVLILFIYIYTFLPISCDVANSTFVATNKWQTVKEGQAIPRGLHVRINLKTGHKEAKLVDKESQNELSTLPEATKEDQKQNDSAQPMANKNIKNSLNDIPGDSLDYSEEKLKELKEKYKSYKEIKKEFKDMNMDIKTDAEIINKLIEQYGNVTKETLNEAEFLRILEDLNYLAHQIDNALWFIDRGGLDAIIVPAIVNQTNINVKVKSLRLLGALTQNNPKAQVNAFERNFGIYLSQVLIVSLNNDELSAAIYAFGSLLRKFPHAQKDILSKSGTKALLGVFNKESIELRVKVKVLTLISDLLVEKQEVLNGGKSHERFQQYDEMIFDTWLRDGKFCEIVNDFVSENRNNIIKESDTAEYLIQSLETTQNLCFDVWSQSPEFRHAILVVINRFIGSKEDFLIEVSERAKAIYRQLFGHLKMNDEL